MYEKRSYPGKQASKPILCETRYTISATDRKALFAVLVDSLPGFRDLVAVISVSRTGRQNPYTSSCNPPGKHTRRKGDNQSIRNRGLSGFLFVPTPNTSEIPSNDPPTSSPLSRSMWVVLCLTTSAWSTEIPQHHDRALDKIKATQKQYQQQREANKRELTHHA